MQIKKKNDNPPNGEKNLTREAYQDIRRMIFLKELNPGQKVAYREMAERLGMSLTPVVQALKHMEFMGLVRHEPNRGFFIEHISPQEIEEAYQLREMLETSLLPGVIIRMARSSVSRHTLISFFVSLEIFPIANVTAVSP